MISKPFLFCIITLGIEFLVLDAFLLPSKRSLSENPMSLSRHNGFVVESASSRLKLHAQVEEKKSIIEEQFEKGTVDDIDSSRKGYTVKQEVNLQFAERVSHGT